MARRLNQLKTVSTRKSEADLWAIQEPLARSSLEFVISFLDCTMGNDEPLDETAKDRLLSILRAVSIVESRHGTVGRNQPARDPIQCGNPKDPWWREFTGQLGNGSYFSRFKRNGYYAKDVGDGAESYTGFPPEARRALLTEPKDGHKNSNFTPTHSYLWGTLYLIHRINTSAHDKSYQCRDLSRERLIDGAVKYNGGGVSDYKTRLIKALAEFGDPLAVAMPAFERQLPINLLAGILATIRLSDIPVTRLQINYDRAGRISSTTLDFAVDSFRPPVSDDFSLGQKVPNQSEVATCGAIAGKIRRTDPEFATLVSNGNPAIVFKDEQRTGADRIMTSRLQAGLDALAEGVASEWPGVSLRVTEAWDEDDEHAGDSLHYEGRAADITTSPVDGRKLGRLAWLAVNAGLDWVYFENSAHVHVSVKK